MEEGPDAGEAEGATALTSVPQIEVALATGTAPLAEESRVEEAALLAAAAVVGDEKTPTSPRQQERD